MGPPNLWVTVWPNTLHQWRIAQGGTMPHPPKHGTGLNTPTFEPRVGLTGQGRGLQGKTTITKTPSLIWTQEFVKTVQSSASSRDFDLGFQTQISSTPKTASRHLSTT